MEKVAEELDFIDNGKYSVFFFIFYILYIISIYILLIYLDFF